MIEGDHEPFVRSRFLFTINYGECFNETRTVSVDRE